MKRQPGSPLNAKQRAVLRRKLVAARRQITRDFDAISSRGGMAKVRDAAEEATDCLELETAGYLGGAMAESLERIDRALRQLQHGTYGLKTRAYGRHRVAATRHLDTAAD